MPDVELQTPEIDDIDETADSYKRWVALLVVSITLFGAIVGYLQTVSSNREDRAAREAEREAIVGLGRQVGFNSAFQHEFNVFTEAELLGRQQAVSSSRQRLAPTPEASEAFARDAARFAAARAALGAQSELVSAGPEDEAVDAAALEADLQVESDRARLRQAANAELVNDHGGKADAYVAVLTVLAVSLFLIGLSLTVVGRGRRLLLIPGMGLALACVVWTAFIAQGAIGETPPEAMEAVAEGNRLMARAEYDEAIGAFDRAVEIRSDYATAYARRADAHFAAGSPQTDVGFVSVTSDEALAASIADGERSLELGGGGDLDAVSSLGFHYFLAGRYDEAERLTNQALDLNDSLAFLWLNLGLIELANGDEEQAAEYYDFGIELVGEEPQGFVRDELFSAARVDLEILDRIEADRDEAVAAFQARLTAAQMEIALGEPVGDPGDAEIDIVAFGTDGSFVQADYEAFDVADETPLAFVWFRRDDSSVPFIEPPFMTQITTMGEERAAGLEGIHFSAMGSCAIPGEYRLDVYAGDRRVASDSFIVEPLALGTLVELSDAAAGISYCHPAEWSRLDPEADPNLVIVAPEDGSSVMSAQTFGLPPDFPLEGDEMLDALIGAAAEGGEFIRPPEPGRVGGADGRVAVVTGDTGPFVVAATAVSDQAVGVVILGAATVEELDVMIAELLPTVRFDV